MNLLEWAKIPRGGAAFTLLSTTSKAFRLATFEESNAGWEHFFMDAPINPVGEPKYSQTDGDYLEFNCGSETFLIRQTRGVGDSIRIGVLEMRSPDSKRWFEIIDRHHIHSVAQQIYTDLLDWQELTK